jgi:beta-phosphoglucomutase-like phosphatase (HAD superfamily)
VSERCSQLQGSLLASNLLTLPAARRALVVEACLAACRGSRCANMQMMVVAADMAVHHGLAGGGKGIHHAQRRLHIDVRCPHRVTQEG